MKKQLVGLSLLAACVSSSALAAGPVANIQVTGDIKPPTCTVNGGDNDLLYSFGNISPSVVPQDKSYNLPRLSNNLTVTCDAETFLTFKATDNYPNPFIQGPGMNINFRAHAFNLVDSADTTKTVGGITYEWENVTVDGNAAYISRANDGDNDNGSWSAINRVVKNATNGWTSEQQKYVSPSALELLSGKIFAATIYNSIGVSYGDFAHTYLHSKNMLANDGIDIADGFDYVGQVILTFSFGV